MGSSGLVVKSLRSLTNPTLYAKKALETWVENQWVDGSRCGPYFPPAFGIHPGPAGAFCWNRTMKIRHSLKSVKARHKDCRIVRRKGRVYVINKTNPRFKARQG